MYESMQKGMLAVDKEIKIVAILPNIIGFTGDCINERQLIKSLRRFSNVSTYSLLPVSVINKLFDKQLLNRVKEDVNLKLLFVHVGYPYTIGLLLSVFYGLLFTVLAIFERPRLIYVRSSGLALFPVMLKKVHKAKVVVKIPSLLEEEFKGVGNVRVHPWDKRIFEKLLYVLDRYVILKADEVAVPSLLFYYKLCKQRRIKNQKPPLVVPPGVDLGKINKIRKMHEGKAIEGKEGFMVGYVGLLEWWQGVNVLVEAIHILQKEVGTKLKLIIIGDGPLRKEIENLCKNLNVHCEITGFMPHEQALKMMRRISVLVVPSHGTSNVETIIPIKVIEAWALGIPVIITRHKIFEYLGNSFKKSVVLCEPTPKSVSDAIRLVMYDQRLAHQLIINGLVLAGHFDYERMARTILSVVNQRKI